MKRGSLILLVLFLGCEPHFKSGKTRCSDKGECPSGFVCGYDAVNSSFVCFDNKIAGGSGGNGGKGGAAGSGATTAPAGGAGGSGGQGGVRDGAADGPSDGPSTDGPASAGGRADSGAGSGGSGGRDGGAGGVGGSTAVSSGTGGTGGTGGTAGGSTGTSPDAGVLSCTNPAYPVYCEAVGTVAAGCWGPDTVCSTITSCSGSPLACSDASKRVFCGGPECCTPPAAGGTCNIPSCGCPTGQVCVPDTPSTGLTCVATDGLGEGTACSGRICADGLGCAGGLCKKYCHSVSDCAAVDSARTCRQAVWSATGGDIPGVSLCARVCDPVSPQYPRAPFLACPSGFGCVPALSSPGASDCAQQSGFGLDYDFCFTSGDCAPGYYCSTSYFCVKYCFSSTDCPMGETCTGFFTPSYAGTTEVGYCY